MDEEIKRKLEEMAKTQLTKKIVMDNPCTDYFTAMYMAGAQAAWTLAVEWERKRIIDKLMYSCECCDLEQRLTPEEVK